MREIWNGDPYVTRSLVTYPGDAWIKSGELTFHYLLIF